jgi:hypothetical protein
MRERITRIVIGRGRFHYDASWRAIRHVTGAVVFVSRAPGYATIARLNALLEVRTEREAADEIRAELAECATC